MPAIRLRKRGYPQLVRAHVRGATLPADVQAEVGRYLQSHPDIRACEAAEHGYDPASDIPRYLAQELAEPDHATVRSGELTVQAIREWERQEDAEHAGDAHMQKDAPDAGDVHVDVPLGSDKKRKRKKGEPAEPDLSVLKTDDEQRIVYGIVLEPDVEDSQGDVISKDDVELAAHRYLYQQGLAIGDQHRGLAPSSVRPVESFIAPCEFEMGGQVVKAGSWVMAAHVPDDELWAQVKKGDKAAWSIGGTGKRRPLDQTVTKDDPVPDEPYGLVERLAGLVEKLAGREPAPIENHVHFNEGAFGAPHVETHNHLPEQPAPVVHNHVQAAEAPVVNVEHHSHVEQPPPRSVRVETDDTGVKRYVAE